MGRIYQTWIDAEKVKMTRAMNEDDVFDDRFLMKKMFYYDVLLEQGVTRTEMKNGNRRDDTNS